MMRLKPYLKSLANPALSYLSLSLLLIIFGCSSQLEPTYKGEDLPQIVKKICKEEYNLNVATTRTTNTLWMYVPLSKLLHQDYGIKADKVFDEEMLDKLRNILNTMGRVLISSDTTPEFFALVASDINLGIDYTIIGSVLDIKKYYAGFVPWTEANRRYVIKFKVAPEAIQDVAGIHVEASDIRLPDFLAEQISQRIMLQFQEDDLKKYFKLESCNGRFGDDGFFFEYSIKEILKPGKKINIFKEMLDIISYCIRTYEFADFSFVQIKDLRTGDKLILNKEEVYRGSLT